MAKPPSWIDKVNFIWYYLQNSCDTDLIVYFETALPPAGNVVIELLSFGMDDVIRGAFKPKGLRSGRHGRKRPKGKPPKGGIPELGEMIGSNLPGSEEYRGKKFSDGVKFLWKVDGVGQRALYYVMVVSLLTDFLFEWAVGIIKDETSNCDQIGRCLYEGPSSGPAGQGWGPYQPAELKYSEGSVVAVPAGVVVGSGVKALVTASAKQRVTGGTDGVCGLRLVSNHYTPIEDTSVREGVKFGDEHEFVVSVAVTGPCTVAAQQLSYNCSISNDDGMLFGMSAG